MTDFATLFSISPRGCGLARPFAGLLMLAAVAVCATPPAARGESPPPPEAAADQSETPEEPPRHAYKLGDFRIKNFRPVEREKVTMEFTVFVEVPDGEEQLFELLWKNHEHRIRNQVITSARLVPPNEFDDPKLRAFRRRIYLRLRRAMPELPIGDVYVSDFSYILE